MPRLVVFAYGIVCYLIFFASFLYAIAFVGNISNIGILTIPKTIDSGAPGDPLLSVLIDAVLLSIFAVQHSVMARPAFKTAWTRVVPHSMERSTYVLLSSLALILMYWLWQPLPDLVWSVGGAFATVLTILFWLGWSIVLLSTFLIDHFELFGLRQVWATLRGEAVPATEFQTPLLYRYVRHPLYLGFVIAFWAAPTMSVGHLLFAIATTGYIFIGIFLEERDLIAHFGETYVAYRKRVSMIVPLPKRGK